MQRLEASGAVRPIYGSLGVKRLSNKKLTQSAALTFPLSKLGEILEGGEVSAADWVSFLLLLNPLNTELNPICQ